MIATNNGENGCFQLKHIKTNTVYNFPISNKSVNLFSVYKNKCIISFTSNKYCVDLYELLIGKMCEKIKTIYVNSCGDDIKNIILLPTKIVYLIFDKNDFYSIDIDTNNFEIHSPEYIYFKSILYTDINKIPNHIIISRCDGKHIYKILMDYDLKIISEGYSNDVDFGYDVEEEDYLLK